MGSTAPAGGLDDRRSMPTTVRSLPTVALALLTALALAAADNFLMSIPEQQQTDPSVSTE